MSANRTSIEQPAVCYQAGDLLIDLAVRRVTRAGEDLGIAGLSLDLLVALVRSAPRLVSVEELMGRVWPDVVVSPETVTQRIKLLRQDLGDSAENPSYIAAARGHGYRMMKEVTALAEVPTPASTSTSRSTGIARLRLISVGIVLTLLVVAGTGFLIAHQSPIGTGGKFSTKDPEAFELFMQARSIARGTDASERQAALLLDQAIAKDPDFADALAYRAITHAGAVAVSGAPAVLLDGAARDASRALALTPRSESANTAQEIIFALRGDWIAAETSFRAAMAAGLSDPAMRAFHDMVMLRPLGRLQQARAELTDNYHRAPNEGFTVHELALTDSLIGLDADAQRLSTLGEQISGIGGPPHTDVFLLRARGAARAGRFAEAAEIAELAIPEPLRTAGGAAAIQAFYGALADPAKRPEALRSLRDFTPKLQEGVVEGRTRMLFVDAFAMLGDLDSAYELAMWCVQRRQSAPGTIDWSDVWMPEMLPFRQDARFQAFVIQLKLPDYWKVYGSPDGCDFKDGTLSCR